MKTKIEKHYLYKGLGFPIDLYNVEMVYIDNEWHPKIDVKKISATAIKALVTQQARLTGHQIKFIRSYFSMSLRSFAENVVHESHTAVSKWEKSGDNATSMDINIEKMIRLYAYDKLFVKTKKQKAEFYQVYRDLNQLPFYNEQMQTLYLAY